MSARDKTGLGYNTQLNELSSNHETDSENSFSVFDGRTSDEDSTPTNDTSSKADGYKVVPPPITGNFLTLRDDISFAGLDEYAIRNKTIESQTSELNTKTIETSGQTNDADTVKPKSASKSVKSNPKIDRDMVIIEDWTSYDEEEVSEVQTVRPETQTVKTRDDKSGQYSKKQGIGVLTRTGFINTARPSISTARPSINTAMPVCITRPSISTARPSVSTARPVYASRPIYLRMDNLRPRGTCSPNKRAAVNTGNGKMVTDLKKSRWVWMPKGEYLDHVSKDSGSFMLKKGNPEIVLQDHAVVDSGCSSHMTGNKAYLSDYEDFNGGFVAFESDPKGDELKFNLFSVSQMCDKKNSVLFTDTECLILSHSFKLLDESQVVLRAPRKDDVYSLDLKNIVSSGGLENQLNHKVKIFKNYDMNVFSAKKRIKREYSVAKTPQQNGVAERKNRTLIEAARTMLADSLLPIPFWAEAINTACYVLNRVLVTKPQNRTPYELLIGKPPSISFMRPFGCLLTILNTLDPLGKFDGKSNEGYLLGYSTTRSRPGWMFDLDFLTNSMNYVPVSVENHVNMDADELDKMISQEIAVKAMNDDSRHAFEEEKKRIASQKKAAQATSTNILSTDRPFVSTNKPSVSIISTPTRINVYLGSTIPIDASTLPNVDLPIDPNMHDLEDASETILNDGIFNRAYDDNEDIGAVADINNIDNSIAVSPIPTLRIHKDHPKGQILGDPSSAVQTRGKIHKASLVQQALKVIGTKWVFRNKRDERSIVVKNKARLVAQGHRQEEGIDYDEVFAPVARIEAIRLFLAFASYMGFLVYQIDVKSAFLYGTIEEEVYVHQPLGFVDPTHPNKVYKVVKALYGLHQAPRAWYETLSSFLLENGFRRGTIDKTLFIKKNKSDIMLVQVYVDDIIFGSTKKSMCTEFEEVMHKRFQMSSMGELTFFLGLQVKQQPDGIFISQDKYVADILKKFDFCSIKTATTPIESNKPLVKDEDDVEVDVHEYRSMIGSLMYLTASRPDIMFAICACARFQVTLKASHLHAVKRIFRYLKHQPRLELWYPRDSLFELEAFSDSDYAGASLDRKSTTGGCQFLGRRLISWQCKKQSIMANSTTEAEYVAAAHCCGQNPVYHSRTKHIEIRHHIIRDCYKKRLIDVLKIYTDSNVADLLTKGFDVPRIRVNADSLQVNSGGILVNSMDGSLFVNSAFLKKPNESVGFTEVVDFLKGSSLRKLANGTQQLVASIDSKEYTITKVFVRSKLQLADATGIHNLSDAEIYAGLATLGPKSGGWDQFGSTVATALICLSSNRVYNFSKMIFDGMVHNLESNSKILMYIRFSQIILDITTENKGRFLAPTLTKKLFANMKMGYAGDIVPLLLAILAGVAVDQGEGSAQPTEPHHTPVDPSSPHPSPPHPSPLHHSPLQSPPYSPPHYSPPRSYEAPLPEGNTSGSVEASMQLRELMVLVPTLVTRVNSLEKELKDTKQTLGNVVLTLVKKVKSLETTLKRKSKKVILSELEGEEPKDHGRIIQDIDDDPLVSLEEDISPTILEAAKTLSKIASQGVSKEKSTDNGKRYRRRARSVAKNINTGIEDVNTGSTKVDTGRTPVSTSSIISSPKKGQREGKAQMVEEDIQATHMTKEQIKQEEAGLKEAIRLQAQMDEEVAKQIHLDAMVAKRMAEEEALSEQQKKRKAQVQFEAQYYTEEDWDAIRAKLEANAELTKDVLGKDLPKQDFAKRMVDTVNQRKKHFTEERAKEKRNKPMTQSQLRIYMSNYLKNQGTWKLSHLKKLKFEEIKKEFNKLVQQIDTFVSMNFEATKEKLKRYGEELQTKTSKKQKIDDKDVPAIEEKFVEVKKEEPIKRTGKRKKQKARKGISVDKNAQGDSKTNKEELVEAMNPTPLATKSDNVVNWKIFQQGQRSIYQIIRANGADTVYMSFRAMIKDFIREDLIELYRLIMQKYGINRLEDAYDRVLWSDLRTMFDPPLNEDAIWSLPLQQKMVSWRYYEKCEVHCLTLEACTIYMLADRKYPLSKEACLAMLKMKLLDGKMDEVCYQLLKMIEKQAGIRK
ncbi:putative ribonuclease H-like domain-containing protein [Tanacetum coccineum]